MELLFKVNDETKVGKAILEAIYAAIKKDKKAIQLVEDDFMDNLIFPGKALSAEQFDKVTMAMEEEGDYISLDQAKKETMALLKKKRNESRNKKRANNNIKKLVVYISDKGYPNTAEKYALRLYDFLYSMADHPNAYTLCKNKKWAAKNYHCPFFDGSYVIPFKITTGVVYIMNVVHGSKLK